MNVKQYKSKIKYKIKINKEYSLPINLLNKGLNILILLKYKNMGRIYWEIYLDNRNKSGRGWEKQKNNHKFNKFSQS